MRKPFGILGTLRNLGSLGSLEGTLGTFTWEPWEPLLGNLYLGTCTWNLGTLGESVLELLRSAPKPLLWLKTPKLLLWGNKTICVTETSLTKLYVKAKNCSKKSSIFRYLQTFMTKMMSKRWCHFKSQNQNWYCMLAGHKN